MITELKRGTAGGGKLGASTQRAAASPQPEPDRLVGQVAPATSTQWLHVDHLGSTRIVTDKTGDVVSRHKYLPFGEEFDNATPDEVNSHKFTGHERDTGTGLDYMFARYYSPKTTFRFLSVDPLAASAQTANPQSWNRYTYASNNPVLYIDPDGQKDDRSDKDKKRTENPKFKEDIAEAHQKQEDTGEEHGTILVVDDEEDTSKTTGVFKIGEEGGPRPSVELEGDEKIEAGAHTHDAAGGPPSKQDYCAATGCTGKTPAPEYVIRPDSLWRVDPDQGDTFGPAYEKAGRPPGKAILTGDDFKAYIREGHALSKKDGE